MEDFEKLVEELLFEIAATNMGIIIAVCLVGLLVGATFILMGGKKGANK